MSLSDDIDNMGSYADSYIDFLHIDDVKQFIKDLKEKFPKNSNHHSSHIIKYINELAGDTLVLTDESGSKNG